MRATHLLGAEVYSSDGEHLGTVHDLRIEMSWTTGHSLNLRLTGLDCRQRGTLGHRLGYVSGEMAGPLPIKAFFTWRTNRHRTIIDWADVGSVGRRRIELAITRAEVERKEAAQP